MSYYQQQNRHRLSIGQDGNALTMLIAINLIVFVILAFIKVIYFFSSAGGDEGSFLFEKNIFDWLTLPADLHKFLSRPWTLITHMFVHDHHRVWHILGNLLWLWAFGFILQDLTGNRKIIPIFIYGALAGALAYMLAFNLVGPLRTSLPVAQAFGASAGIMAIAIAVTTLAPGYRIFTMLNGGIPIWVVTVLYLILDLAMIPESNPGGHIAHLAGGGMGFLFMRMLQRGKDWGSWMTRLYDWSVDLFNPDKPKKGKPGGPQLFYKSKVQPFNKTPLVTQQKIDDILDKINQKGYGSLSDEEKEMLKRASKEDI